ncbi:MAG TPA: hypothetical protein VIV60_04575, partial [Polyangiaceae bacterium]
HSRNSSGLTRASDEVLVSSRPADAHKMIPALKAALGVEPRWHPDWRPFTQVAGRGGTPLLGV